MCDQATRLWALSADLSSCRMVTESTRIRSRGVPLRPGAFLRKRLACSQALDRLLERADVQAPLLQAVELLLRTQPSQDYAHH